MILFASPKAVAMSPKLSAEPALSEGGELEWVHHNVAYRYGSVRAVLRELRQQVAFSLRRRTAALLGRPEPKQYT
jgi:hypothetical protein